MKPKHRGQMSESFLTAVFLSLSGGLQDAYTYLFRGKVFANAQTGNIVLLQFQPDGRKLGAGAALSGAPGAPLRWAC
ncbi:MAG: YoaK family protein [Oscillospiraceae bacterium]